MKLVTELALGFCSVASQRLKAPPQVVLSLSTGSREVGLVSRGPVSRLYKLANRLATVVANRFRGKDRERASIWKSIAADIGKIENFFQERERATIQDIEKITGIERERLTALLKLLKFKHERVKGRTGWTKGQSG